MTPLTLVDTDPAELAVDAIVVGVHSARGTASCRAAAGPGRGERRRRRSTASWPPTLALLGRDRRGRRGDQARHARHDHRAGDRRGRAGAGAGRGRRARRDAAPGGRGGGPRSLAGAGTVALALPLPDGADDDAGRRCGRSPRARCSAPTGSPATRPSRSRAGATRCSTSRCTCPTPRTRRPRRRLKRAAVVDGRGRPHPRLGQHRPQRAAPAGASPTRSPRRPPRPGSTVEVLDEKALQQGRYGGILAVGMGSEAPPRLVTPGLRAGAARRPRSRWSARASRSTPAGTSIKPAAGHVGDEVRHGRRGRGRRHDDRDRRAEAEGRGHRATCRWPRTWSPARRTGRATSSRCTAASGSRCSTPTPRAA